MIWLVQNDAVTFRLFASAAFVVLLLATAWHWQTEMTRKNPRSPMQWKIKVIALTFSIACFEIAAITCFVEAVAASHGRAVKSAETK